MQEVDNYGSGARRAFLVGNNNKIDRLKYINWNKKVTSQLEMRNKALLRVRRAIFLEKLHHCVQLFPSFEINLNTNGIIYCIIHLPSNKIYVGQTINNAMERFFGHWSTRFSYINNRKQFHKQRELLRFMGMSNQVDDFVVWPLERVPHHVYIDHNHRVNKKAFRRYASRIEQKWIDILHTMGKKGMNSVRAMKQSKRKKRKRKNNRRWYRYQDEWERRGQRFQYQSYLRMTQDLQLRMDIENGTTNIKSRKLINRCFIIMQRQAAVEGNNAMSNLIKNLAIETKLRMRNFLIMVVEREGKRNLIDIIITEINRQLSQEHKQKEDQREFGEFIKLVQSNKTLRKIRVGKIINQPRFQHLLPDYVQPINLCVKMLPPIRTYMCNHSKVAKEDFTIPPDNII